VNEYLQFLRQLKSVALSTIDGEHPAVRIADLLLVEEDRLYFLVPRENALYRQLKDHPYLSIVGMDPSYKTVRVTGPIEFVDRTWIEKMYRANPLMQELSRGEQSERLEAYCMPRGVGELFDLSAATPLIERFGFGGPAPVPRGFVISNECTGCGICLKLCPLHCIVEGNPYVIEDHCIECGRCFEHCPVNAIQLPRLFRYEEN
jgi:uncharacterized pyridoxamine 5'-phosphate oxidase family protein/NAD-dependent dihydropyrimidine dehydrogenase PreA subunit